MEGQKEQLSKLISRYEALTTAERKRYNEANTRKNFILPLFDILGWDIRSDDVSEEERASGKRVDYAFKINGITKFFLEAKSLDADLDEIRWSEQAIWYAYHKSVPWVILTNFEKIKVFNAERDSPEPETSLFFELKYTDYLENFEKLLLLSRKSVESGELDKKALEWGKKPKTVSTVGERLTEDLLNWRDNLFNDLVGYNQTLKKEIAADSVQKFINRLIFIRTCEDRGLEQKRLQEVLRAWEDNGKKNNDLIKRIQVLFSEFNDNYDSKLFEDKIIFDADSNKLIFEESVIAKVIEETYKNSRGIRWNFNDINADVLGSVYEQYLGQIQSGKANKEEEKSSKRKSQGIYYTPRYIVDYIVKNTLGEALKGKTFNEILKLKVLDPACGSGSFLIRAFEEALGYLRKETGKINRDFDDYALRWSVLTSMIYGVDLDQEAVEITQLNLLLKTLGRREKLPNLSNKIDCGNSLISGNEAELKKYFGKNWKDKKPFNWEERFPEVFKQGGFDVIIGNPPYIKEDLNRLAFEGLHTSPYYQGKMDIWTLFACRAIDLLKEGGYFSFIAPGSWLANSGASIFRNKILSEGEIVKFIDFSDFKVFEGVGIQTMIFVFRKKKPEKSYKMLYGKINDKNLEVNSVEKLLMSGLKENIGGTTIYEVIINPQELKDKSLSFSSDLLSSLFEKIEKISNFKLKNKDIGDGIDVLQDFVNEKHLLKIKDKSIKKGDGIFILSNNYSNSLRLNNLEISYLKPYYTTKQINRYTSLRDNSKYKIIYADKYFRENIGLFPNLKKHLDRFKNILTSVFAPYGLHRTREERFFKGEGVFLLRKTMKPAFAYVDFPCYVTRAFLILKPDNIDLKYLTALFNSKLFYFWFKNKGKKQGEQLQIDKEPLIQAPIFITTDKNKISIIKNLVDKMLELNKKLQKIDPVLDEEEYKELKTEIDKTDKEIDEKVYKLYGLDPEEIKIIEDFGR